MLLALMPPSRILFLVRPSIYAVAMLLVIEVLAFVLVAITRPLFPNTLATPEPALERALEVAAVGPVVLAKP